MKKQQFNWKGYYVSPSCEMLAMHARHAMLQATYDDQWNTEKLNTDEAEDL